jgi:hypothetical protein
MKKPLVEQGFGSEEANQSLSNPNPQLWFAELHRLVHLQEDLALLPVGWGNEKKGPMLDGWQIHLGYTIPELQATAWIRSVGTRTGISTGPLVCFDVDGETALKLCCCLGMEPWAIMSWQVHRDNEPFRLKI